MFLGNNNIHDKRGREETFGGDGYVYGLDCGDGLIGTYLSPNSSHCIH